MKTMKLLILITTVLLLAPAAMAEWIGIFTEPNPTSIGPVVCADINPNELTTLYIVAILDEFYDAGIVAAEFRVDGWLDQFSPGVLLDTALHGDIIAGDLGHDFCIVWASPQGAGEGYVLMVTAIVMLLDADNLPDNHWMSIEEGESCDCIWVVDPGFHSHDATGLQMLINCVEDCSYCYNAVSPQSWSTLKSLY